MPACTHVYKHLGNHFCIYAECIYITLGLGSATSAIMHRQSTDTHLETATKQMLDGIEIHPKQQ